MAFRPIQTIEPAQPVNMGGLIVKQPLPATGLDQQDPFLLLHHAQIPFRGGQHPSQLGVPPHPHRGFEPVTFIYQGGVHHRDSLGNDSVIGPGGVQWMTAGRGVVHSERPPAALAEDGGTQEIIQLWINLPRVAKMNDPRYQSLTEEETPTVEGEGVTVQVVAGTLAGKTGPIDTHTPILALNARFERERSFSFPWPADYQGFAYLLDGSVTVNEEVTVAGEHLVAFAPGAGDVHLRATAPTRVLLMAGAPIREPIVAQGPFVMNRSVEIYQAMMDYQGGAMGTLDEQF